MNNPSLEKIEEDLQDFLSQYLFDFVDTKEEVSNEINDYLNCIYVTENVVYIKEVSENDDGTLIVDINTNGIIKSRNQKIDDLLGKTNYIENNITINKSDYE